MMASQPVEPIPHSSREVSGDISAGRYETLRVRETIAHLAHEGSWKELWDVADMMSKEVSVLFDLTGRIWVDIGRQVRSGSAPPWAPKSRSGYGCTLIHGMHIGPVRIWEPWPLLREYLTRL